MDESIEKITMIIGDDATAMKTFIANPKEILAKHNIQLNQEEIEHIVEVIKTKVNLEDLTEKGEDLISNIKGFFHR